MRDLVPAWMWKSPEEIIDRLLAITTGRQARPVLSVPHETKRGAARDRYYTMARRVEIRAHIRRLHG